MSVSIMQPVGGLFSLLPSLMKKFWMIRLFTMTSVIFGFYCAWL